MTSGDSPEKPGPAGSPTQPPSQPWKCHGTGQLRAAGMEGAGGQDAKDGRLIFRDSPWWPHFLQPPAPD